jgi:PKD domain
VQTTATIANIAPTVHAGGDARTAPGIYTLHATFSDPGANDAPWSYDIDWGDGFSSHGSTSSQSDEISPWHLYVLPGTYDVRVTVTDKDGGAGADQLALTVTLTP